MYGSVRKHLGPCSCFLFVSQASITGRAEICQSFQLSEAQYLTIVGIAINFRR